MQVQFFKHAKEIDARVYELESLPNRGDTITFTEDKVQKDYVVLQIFHDINHFQATSLSPFGYKTSYRIRITERF